MANNLIEVGLRLRDSFSAGIAKAGANLKGFSSKMNSDFFSVGAGLKNIGGHIQGLVSRVFSLRTAFAGVAAGFAAFRFTEFAVGIEDTDRSFANLVRSFGEKGPEVLGRLRAAVRGTVSDLNLMATANRAILLGAADSGDKLELLATLARRLGKAMGLDTKQAFDDLSLAVGRQSRLILDNLGIIVRVEEANEAYAAAVGKTVLQLTDAEKKQAFWNAVVEGAETRIKALGEDVESLGDIWARMKATVSNVFGSITRSLNPLFRETFGNLEDWLNDASDGFFEFAENIVIAFEQARPKIEGFFSMIGAGLKSLLTVPKLAVDFQLGRAVDNLESAQRALELGLAKPFLGQGGLLIPQPGELGKRRDETYGEWLDRLLAGGYLAPTNTDVMKLRRAMEEKKELDRMVIILSGGVPTGEQIDIGGRGSGEQTLENLRRARDANLARIEADTRQRAEDYRKMALSLVYSSQQMPPGFEGGGLAGPIEAAVPRAEEAFDRIRMAGEECFGAIGDFAKGAAAGLNDFTTRALDTFEQVRSTISGVGNAIADNFAGAFSQVELSLDSFKNAFSTMTEGILRDIARMLLQIAALRLIGGAMQGLAGLGLFNSLPSGANFASFKGYAGGGIATQPSIVAERGQPEAVVPLPDGRTIPVTLSGGGGGGPTVVNYYHIEATDAESFRRQFRAAAMQEQNMLGGLNNRQYQDRPRLRRAYS